MGTGYMCHLSALHQKKKTAHLCCARTCHDAAALSCIHTAGGYVVPCLTVGTKNMMSSSKVRVCVYMVMSAGAMHLQ